MAMIMGNENEESDDETGAGSGGHRRDVPLEPEARPGGRANGSVVMAAMLGIGEALGLDQEQAEVAQAEAAGDQPLELDFGDLPPLS